MLDRERADFDAALAGAPEVLRLSRRRDRDPDREREHEVDGVIDLIDMRAFLHEGDGRGREIEAEIPEEMRSRPQEYREKLMDEVAENSDALMERYLDGEEISHEETVAALKKGVTEGHLFPVTCGIATRNLGHGRLLDALVEDLPSPAMRGERDGAGRGRRAAELAPDPDGELVAQVFKTTADPYTGASTSSGSSRGRCAPTARSKRDARARRSGSASCSSRTARR